jgi:phosphomannomutase
MFLTPLQVFALLCLYLLEIRGEHGPIVKTITTTSMVYRLGEIFKVPVYETAVGFKYVAPKMLAENALIGGEESGVATASGVMCLSVMVSWPASILLT